MSAKFIDGKAISARIRESIRERAEALCLTLGRAPGLAVVLVGTHQASEIYVRNKRQACVTAGVYSEQFRLPQSATEAELLALIDRLNADEKLDGILVQLPLPAHINTQLIVERIHPEKDVDGFHPYNIGRLAVRMPTLRPCTPWGIMKLLAEIGESFYGREAVVIGASNHVGRPMTLELLLAGCTVSTCHRFTRDLEAHVARADIVIVAVGKPGVVKGHWVKSGATVVDVGINRLDSGQLIGDIDLEGLVERAAWITPVPGGVGPMTVAMLLENTLIAAQSRLATRNH